LRTRVGARAAAEVTSSGRHRADIGFRQARSNLIPTEPKIARRPGGGRDAAAAVRSLLRPDQLILFPAIPARCDRQNRKRGPSSFTCADTCPVWRSASRRCRSSFPPWPPSGPSACLRRPAERETRHRRLIPIGAAAPPSSAVLMPCATLVSRVVAEARPGGLACWRIWHRGAGAPLRQAQDAPRPRSRNGRTATFFPCPTTPRDRSRGDPGARIPREARKQAPAKAGVSSGHPSLRSGRKRCGPAAPVPHDRHQGRMGRT
jgi:hypothetical protein